MEQIDHTAEAFRAISAEVGARQKRVQRTHRNNGKSVQKLKRSDKTRVAGAGSKEYRQLVVVRAVRFVANSDPCHALKCVPRDHNYDRPNGHQPDDHPTTSVHRKEARTTRDTGLPTA